MRRFTSVIVVFVIILDQIVKMFIRSSLKVGESIDVIGKFFAISHIENTGAAFSMFEGSRVILIILPLVIAALAFYYMAKHPNEHGTFYWALSLIIGGGIGNMIDRIRFGSVTDMFDFHFWPVFNVADIAICVGCGLMIIYVIFFDKKENKKKVS